MSFYIVPLEVAGTRPARQPKYVMALPMVSRAITRLDDNAIVWATASAAQDTTISGNADAIVVPALGNTIALNATQNALESLNIPSQWLTANMTYRQVIKVLVAMSEVLQRMESKGSKISLAGNLDKTLSQIPAAARQALAATADDFGVNHDDVTGSVTVREALRMLAQRITLRQTSVIGDL